jgi:hypothetical protein
MGHRPSNPLRRRLSSGLATAPPEVTVVTLLDIH